VSRTIAPDGELPTGGSSSRSAGATATASGDARPDRPTRPSAARERILGAATRLFYARGMRAVGVDSIIAESQVAKATFYKHFPSKDDLVTAYLDRVDAAWSGQLHAAAEAAGPEPADQLAGFFDALATACRTEGYRGCGFINSAAESQPGTAAHERTVAHKRAIRNWVRDLAVEAGANDADELATALTLLLDGALSAGALDPDPRAVDVAHATARHLVDEACRS